jgi:TFIIF-interacting CTD phosphatase-like protein
MKGIRKKMKASQVKRLANGKISYRGETFNGFNKPKRNTSGSRHKEVVLAKKGDDVKLVRYGHKDYGHNYSKEARENYLKRSAGIRDKSGNLTKDDKFSPNYWARKRLWAGPGKSVARPKPGGPRK